MIDIPEECKTADEILNALFEKRTDMIEAGVFEPNKFTMRLSRQQMDAMREFKLPLFNCPDTSSDTESSFAGFIIEEK